MAQATQLDDSTRIQKLLDEIKSSKADSGGSSSSGKPGGPAAPPTRALEMEPAARTLLMEYVNEITCAILEEAACVASHKGSIEIEAADVCLVLAKKFAIEVPGAQKIKSLHRHAHKASWPSIPVGTSVHDSVSKVQAEQQQQVTVQIQASGQKRKIGDVVADSDDREE